GAVGDTALSEVVQHHASTAERHVPVGGLVQVVVQTDHCALAPVATVALHHLSATGKPVASIGLDEEPAGVAVDVGGDDEDAVDLVDRLNGWHGPGAPRC